MDTDADGMTDTFDTKFPHCASSSMSVMSSSFSQVASGTDLVMTDCLPFISPGNYCPRERPCGLRHNQTLRNLISTNSVDPASLPICPDWTETGRCPRGLPCVYYHPHDITSDDVAAVAQMKRAPSQSLEIFWDTENCHLPFPPQPAQPSASEIMRSLEHVLRVVTGATGPVRVHAYHSRNLRDSDKTSLRAFGADVIDAGTKANCVDSKLKDDFYGYVLQTITQGLPTPQVGTTTAADQQRPMPHMVMVSGDRDFADTIRAVRSVGMGTVIVYNDVASTDYTSLAATSMSWDTVLMHAAFAGRARAGPGHSGLSTRPYTGSVVSSVGSMSGLGTGPGTGPGTSPVTQGTGHDMPRGTGNPWSQSKQTCQYFLRQSCARGLNCTFAHPCANFARGACSFGTACKYDHSLPVSGHGESPTMTYPSATSAISHPYTTETPSVSGGDSRPGTQSEMSIASGSSHLTGHRPVPFMIGSKQSQQMRMSPLAAPWASAANTDEPKGPDIRCETQHHCQITSQNQFISAQNDKYKTMLCSNHSQFGQCKFGDRCVFAHGVEELRQFPQQSYRT